MVKVVLREGETAEDLIRRFKAAVKKSGILQECRKREFFLKKSLARKRKSEEARKAMIKKADKNISAFFIYKFLVCAIMGS